MQLSRMLKPRQACRQLAALCGAYKVTQTTEHSAMDDAVAAAQVLDKQIQQFKKRFDSLPIASSRKTRIASWPDISPSGRIHSRGRPRRETAFAIQRVLNSLAEGVQAEPEAESYLALLDRVLEDRRVTSEEADELCRVATELNLHRPDVAKLHQDYYKHLVRVYWRDGVLTDLESADLREVRELLAISADHADSIIASVKEESPAGATAPLPSLLGMSICFTGQMMATTDGAPISRDMIESIATSHGMVVRQSVSKKLDFLVAADPDSMSGKAKKARKAGVRVLSEAAFWNMVGGPPV
jgi:DNA polymerase-3 subunit epsilon